MLSIYIYIYQNNCIKNIIFARKINFNNKYYNLKIKNWIRMNKID